MFSLLPVIKGVSGKRLIWTLCILADWCRLFLLTEGKNNSASASKKNHEKPKEQHFLNGSESVILPKGRYLFLIVHQYSNSSVTASAKIWISKWFSFSSFFHQLLKWFCADPNRHMSTQSMLGNTKSNFHSTHRTVFSQFFTVTLFFISLAWMDSTVYWSIMSPPKSSWKLSSAGIKCMKLRKDDRSTGLRQHRTPTEWVALFIQSKDGTSHPEKAWVHHSTPL